MEKNTRILTAERRAEEELVTGALASSRDKVGSAPTGAERGGSPAPCQACPWDPVALGR